MLTVNANWLWILAALFGFGLCYTRVCLAPRMVGPVHIAVMVVTLSNLKATAMAFVLDAWKTKNLTILRISPNRKTETN